MKEEKETEYFGRGHVFDSEAYQSKTVVSVVCMQKKKS